MTGPCMFEEWLQNRSNRVPFNKIWLLSMRRLPQDLREIRMPADLANRFVANMTLLNAKKTRADFRRPWGAKRHESYRTTPRVNGTALNEDAGLRGASVGREHRSGLALPAVAEPGNCWV